MDINDWRARIDTVDRLIVDLINRRMEYALEIGKIKNDHGQPVRDEERERSVMDALRMHNKGPVGDDALADIFSRLIEEARTLEKSPPPADE